MTDNKENTPESSPELSPGAKKSYKKKEKCAEKAYKKMEELAMKGNREFESLETFAKKQFAIADRDARAINRELVKDTAKYWAECNASILKEFKPSVSTKKGSTNKK